MKMKSAVKKLFDAFETSDYTAVIDLSAKNKSKKVSFTFVGTLKTLKEEDLESLWKLVTTVVIEISDSAFETNKDISHGSAHEENMDTARQVIVAAMDIASAAFELETPISNSVLHLAIYLNGIIFQIPNHFEGLKNSIAQFCEKVYHHTHLKERSQYFLYNTITYLLIRSLNSKATKTDVKRVCALRQIIPTVLAMNEVDKKEIFNLLKKCAVNKLYLQMPEGIKVVSLSLTLDVMYIAEIHASIKSRLSCCSVKTAAAYGKVYFTAWSFAVKTECENLKNVLEISCIEDLVLLGVNAKHNKALLTNVRKLLNQIHLHKKETYVTNMLYNLYQPLLWRYLRNYDARIRANATQLFLDVFPIANPDMGVVATDLHLNEQLLMIKDLLLDEVADVRIVTVIGLCIAMSVNWELFPEEILKTYFKIIIEDLCYDSSSAEVRCAVAKGIKVLMENPLTYPTLQRILPKFHGLFHDMSDSVRVAFCQVLMRVKRISSIKYFNIVEPDHLLIRLEDDCHAVSRAIVNLLSNSYFPKATEFDECMFRCIQLIRTNHAASRVFFRYITSYISLETAVKFVVQGMKTIHHYVTTKVKTNKLVPLKPNENINTFSKRLDAMEGEADFQNPIVVKGIVDAATIIWIASKQKLDQDENKFHLKYMVVKLAKILPDLVIYFKESPIWESLCYFSSYMPSDQVPSLSSLCYFQLQHLPDDAKEDEFMTSLESLCNQNASRELLELIQEWVTDGIMNVCTSPPAKKRRSSCRTIIPASKSEGKPLLATRMLSFMLDHRVCQNTLLQTCPDLLIQMLSSIDLIKEKFEQMDQRSHNEYTSILIKETLFNLMKIAALLYYTNTTECDMFIENLLSWCSSTLLQHLKHGRDMELQSSGKRRKSRKSISPEIVVSQLAADICKDVFTTCSDMVSLGCFDTSKCSALIFSAKVLQLESAATFILPVSRLLNKHLFYAIVLYTIKNDTSLAKRLPTHFCEIINCLRKENCIDSIPFVDGKEIQSLLPSIIQAIYEAKMYQNEYSNLTSLLVESVVDSFVKCSQIAVEKKSCEPFKRICVRGKGAFFYTLMTIRPKMMPLYLKALYKCFLNSEIKIENFIAYCIILWSISELKCVSSKTNIHINNLLNSMKGALDQIYPPQENDTDIENSADDEDSVENTQYNKESFRNHCKNEFSKLQRRYKNKNYTVKEGA